MDLGTYTQLNSLNTIHCQPVADTKKSTRCAHSNCLLFNSTWAQLTHSQSSFRYTMRLYINFLLPVFFLSFLFSLSLPSVRCSSQFFFMFNFLPSERWWTTAKKKRKIVTRKTDHRRQRQRCCARTILNLLCFFFYYFVSVGRCASSSRFTYFSLCVSTNAHCRLHHAFQNKMNYYNSFERTDDIQAKWIF